MTDIQLDDDYAARIFNLNYKYLANDLLDMIEYLIYRTQRLHEFGEKKCINIVTHKPMEQITDFREKMIILEQISNDLKNCIGNIKTMIDLSTKKSLVNIV